MNREGQTMKKTFKTLTALLATATLAFGLTACNDKEPAKDGAKTVSSLEQIQKMAKCASVYLAINHHWLCGCTRQKPRL